ncbi:tRNA methyltransferase [Mycena sp. CBHHK59/15]|nr:tRNA methyltransferase [Mycena sp. CBHHK59/15]
MASNSITVPDGFTLHTENNSHILLSANEAFLNPVQEFNRDTSIACIRVWSEELEKVKQEKWLQTQDRQAKKKSKRPKLDPDASVGAAETASKSSETTNVAPSLEPKPYVSYGYVVLEALSATGLRSIRYAKEIPLVRHVIANDLSSAATAAMKRNIDLNGLGPSPENKDGKIRVNEGDACTLMYNHREAAKRVHVVDLDPYGTAAPFIDAAVQCILDDGLLCVTCTDLTVLATANYPEKCFSNYGGVPLRAEYCHEAALRLVLHSVSTSAARYGRYIQPLLSLSIDFYVRLFIRVRSSPLEVKKAVTKTSTYWICTNCQTHYEQPLAKVTEKVHERGNVNYQFKLSTGPPVMDKCPECDSVLHVAGPMWSAPIHDPDFVGKVLEHLEDNQTFYGTAARMKGMLTVAKEELVDCPFYFTPTRVAGFFHCETPSLVDVASALLHAGHKISRSHTTPGSIKTTASRAELYDIFRSWIKLHPVKRENLSANSPAHRLLDKELRVEADFTQHPDAIPFTRAAKIKLVRYQENPAPYWGPGTKAVSGTTGSKRKRGQEE